VVLNTGSTACTPGEATVAHVNYNDGLEQSPLKVLKALAFVKEEIIRI
jgi:hypothetical protein